MPTKTEIPCPTCKGTKSRPLPTKSNPDRKIECGACLGTGESTAPWDRARKGTTVVLSREDLLRHVPTETRSLANVSLDCKLLQRVLQDMSPKLKDLRVLGEGHVDDRANPTRIVGILIDWENPEYAERLAAYKSGTLYSDGVRV